MTKNLLKKLAFSIKEGRKNIESLNEADKKTLERKWDIEHAYYSSALEGSKIDRKEFDKLAEKVS